MLPLRTALILSLLILAAAMPARADFTGLVVNAQIVHNSTVGGPNQVGPVIVPNGQFLTLNSALPNQFFVLTRAFARIQPILNPAFAVTRFVGPQRVSTAPGVGATLSIDFNAAIQITGPQAATVGFIRWIVPRVVNRGSAQFRGVINFTQDGVGPIPCDTGLFTAPPGISGPWILSCTVALNGVPAGFISNVQAVGSVGIQVVNSQVGTPGAGSASPNTSGNNLGDGGTICTTGDTTINGTISDCTCYEVIADDGTRVVVCDPPDWASLEADEDQDGEDPPPTGGAVSVGIVDPNNQSGGNQPGKNLR